MLRWLLAASAVLASVVAVSLILVGGGGAAGPPELPGATPTRPSAPSPPTPPPPPPPPRAGDLPGPTRADIEALFLTADEIRALIEREPWRLLPALERPPLDPDGTEHWVDRFGTIFGPEVAALPHVRPLTAGTERSRFVSEEGGFSFLYPTGWTVERADPGRADLLLVLSNQAPATRPAGPIEDAFQIKIVYVREPVAHDPVTLERRPAPSLAEIAAADDTPPSIGWRRLDEVNGRTVLRSYGSEAGDIASVLFEIDGRAYGLTTEDVHSVYFAVLEEVVESMEFVR